MRYEVASVAILAILEPCRPVCGRSALIGPRERLDVVDAVTDHLPYPHLLVEWRTHIPACVNRQFLEPQDVVGHPLLSAGLFE